MGSQRQQFSTDELVRAARDGSLTRREFLRRAAVAGIVVGAPGILAACGPGSETTGPVETDGSPATLGTPGRPGGTMRIALPAGAGGALDPHAPATTLHARLRNTNVFDPLFTFDNAGALVPMLAAEEATANSDATEWTIRIGSDIEFHDGSPLTVEDVIYSLRRILDPSTSAEGAGQIGMVDANGIRKLDDVTLLIPLNMPFAIFPAQLASGHVITIVKDGEEKFDPPTGTGAFKFEGGDDQNFTLTRNPNYWQSGLPLLERVEVTAIADATARLNALKTDEVDAIHPSDFTQAASVENDGSLTVFVNKTGSYMPMYMKATEAPFSDNRVREALKFAADRERMNDLAYGGHGLIGNDVLVPPTAPDYPPELEQRTFDPERARSLWNEAGMAGTQIELWTSNVWAGQETSAIAYAEQAKQAGIDISIQKAPDDQFISTVYGIKPFAHDFWKFSPALTVMSLAFVPGADYFDTAAWATPETTSLYEEAVAQVDNAKRDEIVSEIMVRFRNEGPYIVWAFEAGPDIYSAKVGGQENSLVRGLNGFRLEKFFIKS